MARRLTVSESKHIPNNQDYYDARFGGLSQDLNEDEKRRCNVICSAIEHLRFSSETQILDFGCGRGWLAKALQQFGKVTGFDLSAKAIENASASFPDLVFKQVDAETPVATALHASFDLLVSSEVIEHTLDQALYLRNCANLLKPGASLILTTPNGRWKNDFYRDGREQWQQPLENWRTAGELKTLLEAEGFSEISITSFNSEWHFDFRPKTTGTRHLTHPLSRKFFKLTKQYNNLLLQLNAANYGLNLLILAKKK